MQNNVSPPPAADASVHERPLHDLPQAELRPRRNHSWAYIWMLPVLAVLLSAWLIIDAWRERGPLITIQFQQGHGISAGDALRYRGIDVGQVESVTLSGQRLDQIQVAVRLTPEARGLVRTDSRFWIVRPQLSAAGVSGLDTVIGANYIGILPGRGDTVAPKQSQFVGLERSPPVEAIEPGGLEVVLRAPGRGNLKVGAPISYRQVLIGTVIAVDLAKDASSVEARAYIKPDYVNLIRRNVRFWRASGAQISAGLSGLSVAVESVHSLILGSINLAIPPYPGKRVTQNAAFTLHDEPENAWLSWVPGLSLSDSSTNDNNVYPKLVPVQLSWRYRNWLYLQRDAQYRGWLLPYPTGLVGPANALIPTDDASNDSVRLRLDGERLAPGHSAPLQLAASPLALLPLSHDYPVWPLSRHRALTQPEDILIVTGDQSELPARFVSAERLQKINPEQADSTAPRWSIDPQLPFNAQWHGAAAVAESDGALLGLVLVDDEQTYIVNLPAPNTLEDHPPPAADNSP